MSITEKIGRRMTKSENQIHIYVFDQNGNDRYIGYYDVLMVNKNRLIGRERQSNLIKKIWIEDISRIA